MDELTAIYGTLGVEPALAREVAAQMMAKDALGTHLRDELGLSDITGARAVQAVLISAATFSVGAALPLTMVLVSSPDALPWAVSAASLVFLAILGALGAWAGGGTGRTGDAAGDVLGRTCHGADRRDRRACGPCRLRRRRRFRLAGLSIRRSPLPEPLRAAAY